MSRLSNLWLLLCLCLIAANSVGSLTSDEKDLATDGDPDEEDDEPTSCPPSFEGRCKCGNVTTGKGHFAYVTNCTDTKFTNASMLSDLPIETEILIFTGNNITELPQNLIKNKNLHDKLRVIDLSGNRIRSARGKTFHDVKNVKRLILSNNQILMTGQHFHPRIFSNFESLEELHLKNAFGDTSRGINFMEDMTTALIEGDLKNLKVLHLEHNSFKSLPHEFVFCALPSLQKLFLGSNMLMDIKINVTCNRKLRFLDMSDNFIQTLNNESLAFLEEGKDNNPMLHVNLTRNPFRCNCQMQDFYEWLKMTKVWVIGNKTFHCSSGFPKDNIGKPFSQLTVMDLMCPALEEDDMRGYITASYAVLITLMMALCILVGALLYTNREHLTQAWSHVATSIAAKREYTSLEQESKRQQQQTIGGNSNSNSEVDEVAV